MHVSSVFETAAGTYEVRKYWKWASLTSTRTPARRTEGQDRCSCFKPSLMKIYRLGRRLSTAPGAFRYLPCANSLCSPVHSITFVSHRMRMRKPPLQRHVRMPGSMSNRLKALIVSIMCARGRRNHAFLHNGSSLVVAIRTGKGSSLRICCTACCEVRMVASGLG